MKFELKEDFVSIPSFTNYLTQIAEELSKKSGKTALYINLPFVFDIEVTSWYNDSNDKRSTMYAWVFGCNGSCVLGRTWDEFIEIIDKVRSIFNLSIEKRIIIYVHNLSYEFQFIRKHFTWENVFAIEEREPLYALTTFGVEFRCSYMLSGSKLDDVSSKLSNYKVAKLTGYLDYSKRRHYETELTENERKYILHDGLVVLAYIEEQRKRYRSIGNIPLTKTGVIRRLIKKNCLSSEYRFRYSRLMKQLTMGKITYYALKRAFAGGFTHANALVIGDEDIVSVQSYDIISSYPSVMLSEQFPMSKGIKKKLETKEEFYFYIKNYCCIFDAVIYNLRPKIKHENYIQSSKCIRLENYINNNGRIAEADLVDITLTEQDFFIISDAYKWDTMEIFNFQYFYKDYLPKPFILTIIDLYKKKTELKGVKGKESEYSLAKESLNSCYGMCVTDPCRESYLYDSDGWYTREVDVDTALYEHNTNKQRCLFYPWGVWVAAYARRNLWKAIIAVGDDYLYSDTDSVKIKNGWKHTGFFNDYNKDITTKIELCCDYHDIPRESVIFKNSDGEIKPLGIWELDGEYDRFKTLGAKRYIFSRNDDIGITIAGVAKREGAEFLKWKYKTIDKIFKKFSFLLNFPPTYYTYEDGQKVKKSGCGKLCHTYLDFEFSENLTDYMGKDAIVTERSGIHLEPTDYSMSPNEQFKRMLYGWKDGGLLF